MRPGVAAEGNGVPGFAPKYTSMEEDTPINEVTFFLFGGPHGYQIAAQATSEDWETVTRPLEAAVKSFTVQ
jgi:hypothetical protein